MADAMEQEYDSGNICLDAFGEIFSFCDHKTKSNITLLNQAAREKFFNFANENITLKITPQTTINKELKQLLKRHQGKVNLIIDGKKAIPKAKKLLLMIKNIGFLEFNNMELSVKKWIKFFFNKPLFKRTEKPKTFVKKLHALFIESDSFPIKIIYKMFPETKSKKLILTGEILDFGGDDLKTISDDISALELRYCFPIRIQNLQQIPHNIKKLHIIGGTINCDFKKIRALLPKNIKTSIIITK